MSLFWYNSGKRMCTHTPHTHSTPTLSQWQPFALWFSLSRDLSKLSVGIFGSLAFTANCHVSLYLFLSLKTLPHLSLSLSLSHTHTHTLYTIILTLEHARVPTLLSIFTIILTLKHVRMLTHPWRYTDNRWIFKLFLLNVNLKILHISGDNSGLLVIFMSN